MNDAPRDNSPSTARLIHADDCGIGDIARSGQCDCGARAYAGGVRDATARIIGIIEAMDEPRSIRSLDCSDVFTPAAFEDWCDDLLAAIQGAGNE